MSLSVLVDQTVRWEGNGAARHRVLVPPAPETLKTIKDLVAAVTGFNAERGDQLIVESLPFESSLNAAAAASSLEARFRAGGQSPAWLEFATKYRDLWAPVTLGTGACCWSWCAGSSGVARRAPPAHEKSAFRLSWRRRLPATELSPAAAPNRRRALGCSARSRRYRRTGRARPASRQTRAGFDRQRAAHVAPGK